MQAGQQQRRAQLKMAMMDQLYTRAMAGNAGAQIVSGGASVHRASTSLIRQGSGELFLPSSSEKTLRWLCCPGLDTLHRVMVDRGPNGHSKQDVVVEAVSAETFYPFRRATKDRIGRLDEGRVRLE